MCLLRAGSDVRLFYAIESGNQTETLDDKRLLKRLDICNILRADAFGFVSEEETLHARL